MNKAEIMSLFQTDLENPGAVKNGEYLETIVLSRAKRVIESNRQDLVLIMREWLYSEKEPTTMLAISVIDELQLIELAKDVENIKLKIQKGELFFKFYLNRINNTLDKLKECQD